MSMENLSDDIIAVNLDREPKMNGELKTVTDVVHDRDGCDVILDFANVDIITSQSLSRLLKLRQLLIDCGRRLILCNVNAFTKSAFKVTGLDGIFELVEDKVSASAELQGVS